MSGLKGRVPLEQISGPCIVFVNLKARKMAGILSHGMVMCAVSQEGDTLSILRPPIDSKAGDTVTT